MLAPMLTIAVVLAVFLAVFVQSLAGFGVALVGMPLLVALVGVRTASPLIALLGVTLEVFLLLYYRAHVDVRVVWRLVAAAAVGIPLGIWALNSVPEDIVLAVLGAVVLGYALYGLLNLRLPRLSHALWPWLLGFASGVLGGAYNTAGPPVIIYGNCRRWSPAEFKANLQGFFLPVSLFVAVGHALGGNLTIQVWQYYLLALAPTAVGIVAGLRLDRRVNAQTFRKLVLWLLVVLGASLLWGSVFA